MREQQLMKPGTIADETGAVYFLRGNLAENGVVSGTIQKPFTSEGESFASLDQAVLVMKRWMDRDSVQARSTSFRTFVSKKWPGEDNECADRRLHIMQDTAEAPVCSEVFLIHILYQQHTSWQGEIQWMGRRVFFRSVMEMLSLIRTTMESCKQARLA